MNRVETALINSPPRRWLQRFYEVPVLLRLGAVSRRAVQPSRLAVDRATAHSWCYNASAPTGSMPSIWIRR